MAEQQSVRPSTQDPKEEVNVSPGGAGGSRDNGLETSGAELVPEGAVYSGAIPKRLAGMRDGAENGHGEAALDKSSSQEGESFAMSHLQRLTESVARLNAESLKRDVLLEKLEESVTSLAEDWHPIKRHLETTIGNGGLGVRVDDESVEALSQDRIRTNCVDAMLGKTVFDCSSNIVSGVDVSEVQNSFKSRFRGLYETMYDAGHLTSPLLRYLCSRPKVEIVVDCFTSSIFTMLKVPMENRSKYLHEGRVVVDLKREKVYFGGTNGNKPPRPGQRHYEQYTEREVSSFLAMGLAQLATHLIFENGGRPFDVLDVAVEHKLHRVLQSVENGMRGNSEIHEYVKTAMGAKLQTQRECAIIAAVPGAAVERVSSDGLWDSDALPLSLLLFYECQVLGKLNEILKNRGDGSHQFIMHPPSHHIGDSAEWWAKGRDGISLNFTFNSPATEYRSTSNGENSLHAGQLKTSGHATRNIFGKKVC